MHECIMRPGENCTECGKCDCCDLDESKLCDNCCRCLGDNDYNGIEITEIILPQEIKIKKKRTTKKKQ